MDLLVSLPGLHPSYLCACVHVHKQQVAVAYVVEVRDRCSYLKAKIGIRHKSLMVHCPVCLEGSLEGCQSSSL